MSTPEAVYRYMAPSSCAIDGRSADLTLATSGGASANPRFFDGLVAHPRQTAAAMLLVARIARTRFYDPMSASKLASLDPVVTAGDEHLRFESFSACCGVYARLDLLPEGLDDGFCGIGTTNVDFNVGMRQALGRVTDRARLRVEVGLDDVTVSSGGAGAVERKVPLPKRWLRGFAQVPVDLASMEPRLELDGASARRFLQGLPNTRSGRELVWAVPSARSLRLTTVPTPDAVCVAGPTRLRVAADLGAHVRGLRAYGPAAGGAASPAGAPEASAWEVLLDGARLTLTLSPEPARGFSGEGGLLYALALGLPHAEDAAAGRSGFDLVEQRWFLRHLPFDLGDLEADNPRLRDARTLAADGGAEIDEDAGRATVRTADAVHTVRFLEQPEVCTCPWYAKHAGSRGPCKHVLAVVIVRAKTGATS